MCVCVETFVCKRVCVHKASVCKGSVMFSVYKRALCKSFCVCVCVRHVLKCVCKHVSLRMSAFEREREPIGISVCLYFWHLLRSIPCVFLEAKPWHLHIFFSKHIITHNEHIHVCFWRLQIIQLHDAPDYLYTFPFSGQSLSSTCLERSSGFDILSIHFSQLPAHFQHFGVLLSGGMVLEPCGQGSPGRKEPVPVREQH